MHDPHCVASTLPTCLCAAKARSLVLLAEIEEQLLLDTLGGNHARRIAGRGTFSEGCSGLLFIECPQQIDATRRGVRGGIGLSRIDRQTLCPPITVTSRFPASCRFPLGFGLTNHACGNRTEQPARIVFVLLDGEFAFSRNIP